MFWNFKVKLPFVISLIVTMSSFVFVHGQCTNIHVSGKVLDTLNYSNFYYTVIHNRTQDLAFFAEHSGSFSFEANLGDSIVIAVRGYPKESFTVSENKDCRMYKVLHLKFKSNTLNTVLLRPIRSVADIKEERRQLALEQTRTITGAEILKSPITYLYETFSQKERNKKWVAEQRYKDRQIALIKDYLRTCMVYKIIELKDEELDDFIVYLNMETDFFKHASDYELVLFIKKGYKSYVERKQR